MFAASDVKATMFPSQRVVSAALAQLRLPPDLGESCFKGFVSTRPRNGHVGYQVGLAIDLTEHLRQRIIRVGVPVHTSGDAVRYSPALGEKADLAFGDPSGTRGFAEVEFRPNIEKDLVKFQIGHNSRRLAVAMLLVAVDRRQINPSYTTMPEYAKIVRVVRELAVGYPLIVVGVSAGYVES